MVVVVMCFLYRRYDVASECISYLLYLCSDIGAKYKADLDHFEYACSHITDRDGMSCLW